MAQIAKRRSDESWASWMRRFDLQIRRDTYTDCFCDAGMIDDR